MPPQRFLSLLALLVSAVAVPHLPSATRSTTCPVTITQDPPSTSLRQLIQLNQTNSPTSGRQTDVVTPRIVNGDFISPNLLPYMVALTGRSLCTGTLVSSTWVVTAAHCRVDSTWQAEIGTRRAGFTDPSNVRRVRRFEPHPDYVRDIAEEYDFALVELGSPAPGSAKFMKVNADKNRLEAGAQSRVMGYGTTQFETPSDAICRQVDVPISDESVCLREYPSVNTKFQYCAGYERGGCDSCQGDSGGPMIQYEEGEPVLVGVVSSGRGCAFPNIPGVYVRTSAFIGFMNDQDVDYTKSGSTGLSAGAIAGIVIVCLFLVTAAIVGAIFFIRKRRAAEVIPAAPATPGAAPGVPSAQPGYPGYPPRQPGYPGTSPGGAVPAGVPTVPVYPVTPVQAPAAQVLTPPYTPTYSPPLYPGVPASPTQSAPTYQPVTPPQAPASPQVPSPPQVPVVVPTPPPPPTQ